MNEIQALSRIINYDINDSGKCVADYCEEECEVVAKALTELAEIKKVVKNWDEGEDYTDSIHSMKKIEDILKGELRSD